MPVITPGDGTREQAITDIIQSVALQEAALAHILNAEGEKMQEFEALPNMTPELLLSLDNSVQRMINAVTRLEMMLQAKIELFADALVSDETDSGQPAVPPIEP